MYTKYARENTVLVAVMVFVVVFGLIQLMKPTCLYNRDGSIRSFGLGYKNKTILPIWLVSLVLGILSYLGVLYFVNAHRISY